MTNWFQKYIMFVCLSVLFRFKTLLPVLTKTSISLDLTNKDSVPFGKRVMQNFACTVKPLYRYMEKSGELSEEVWMSREEAAVVGRSREK